MHFIYTGFALRNENGAKIAEWKKKYVSSGIRTHGSTLKPLSHYEIFKCALSLYSIIAYDQNVTHVWQIIEVCILQIVNTALSMFLHIYNWNTDVKQLISLTHKSTHGNIVLNFKEKGFVIMKSIQIYSEKKRMKWALH